MVYGNFHEKSLTKMSYLELLCLDFKANELGFWLLKQSRLSNLWPIFGRVVHISISNNFCNYGFLGCHIEMDFPFYRCVERPDT
jgi:hypothetical protein